MDLSHIRTFLAVYRAGSLTAAAPLLGLSQPTVTAQIQALEGEMGQRLFQRLARGVAPTPVADELARQVAAPIDALAAVTGRGLPGHRTPAPPVHLAGPPELTTMRALPALAGLVDQGLRLRVTTGQDAVLLAGLGTGRFDIVISAVRPRGKALTATPLMDEEFVLVAAPAWADRVDRARLGADPVAALRGVPLVACAEDLPVIRGYWRTVFGARPAGGAAVVVPDLRAVLSATLAGAGVTVLPHHVCAAELAAGDLVALLRPEVPPAATLFLVTRAGAAALPHLAAVHETLLAAAPSW
ncbi:LysR family transcriptional regulator [Sphaerisporangium corydalis]|uniref:LysR family transcriptional regulator n=1 Tax=Sphaerisporangium corydalis TaxID=1441875 RepID=A0ABV9E885_9ACTN|nr:LysR family transcriptional regulator [Sphaerisporangium corydalis]